MITTKKFIFQQFEKNIEQEGLFWRLARPDTFIDLLMLQAGKSSKIGINDKLALEVIFIAVKALVNNRLGLKDYAIDYKQLEIELSNELDTIFGEIDQILSQSIMQSDSTPNSLPLSDDLSYFKVLNNLEIDKYSVTVFENVLNSFISFIKSKNL
ncbi:hypothetical protein [Sphingobacterium sp. MYb388]|uniref:hypothetical protein n=1 Tax=Sphingobacterium sp. MYb388 TaxID=2745437 RepID=UPI00309A3159